MWLDDATLWESLVATLLENLTSAGYQQGAVTLPQPIDREDPYALSPLEFTGTRKPLSFSSTSTPAIPP